MPRFRFKVIDVEGRQKAGHLKARDRVDAEERIRKSGYTIVELAVAGPELHVDTGPVSRVRRRRRRPYRPGLFDVFRRVQVPPRIRNLTLATLVVVGLVVSLSMGGDKIQAEGEQYEPVRLAVRGRIAPVEKDVILTFHFPQIPLMISRRALDIADENGDYLLEYDFESGRRPGYCTLTATGEGYATRKLGRVRLSGDPLSCDLPAVVLSRER